MDTGIGAALMANRAHALRLGRFRAVAGITFATWALLTRFYKGVFLLLLLHSAGIAALLFGPGATIQTIIGVCLICPWLIFCADGIWLLIRGRSPSAGFVSRTLRIMTPLESGRAYGKRYPYSMGPLGPEWLVWKGKPGTQRDAGEDLRLRNLKYNASIIVIAYEADPGYVLVLEKLVPLVLRTDEQVVSRFTVAEKKPLSSHPGRGILVEASGRIEGRRYQYHIGIFAMGRYGFQVGCFAPQETFASVSRDCDTAVRSFMFIPEEHE